MTNVPTLKSLPPTSAPFEENVKRAHLQVCIWKQAMDLDPPRLDLTLHGWQKDKASKSLSPGSTQPRTKAGPLEVLELIRCGCATDESCKTGKCGSMTVQLSCTVFCACNNAEHCNSRWTRRDDVNHDEETDLDEELLNVMEDQTIVSCESLVHICLREQ